FGDRHQAAAMRSLLQEFVFDRVILFFTEDTYGSALGYDIERTHTDRLWAMTSR
ncbi:unnamed protein product, partial [Closterium sp. NIES-53]